MENTTVALLHLALSAFALWRPRMIASLAALLPLDMILILGNEIDITEEIYHIGPVKKIVISQPVKAVALLAARGMVRSSEFTAQGITAATIRRLEAKGQVTRLARGLYGLPDVGIETHYSLAEAVKRVPKGTICLSSALAFHELTDAIPSRVWLALGQKDWAPKSDALPLQIVRFGPKVLADGIETHEIAGVSVRIYSPAKTIVDLFRYRQSEGTRYRRSPGLALAIEGLREGLRTGKATPAAIAAFADAAGVWKVVEPYLDALTTHV